MKVLPKKRFGQHFLRDTGILDRIVRLLNPGPQDLVIEIGAGDGALSSRLAHLTSHLLAVEIDPDCLPRLGASLAGRPQARVIEGDILRMDLRKLIVPYLDMGLTLRVVGNLPYNIATAIIEMLLHSSLPISDMLFMVQLEVAERIVASPGSRRYGFFSVDCQRLAEARIHLRVPPACFSPRPRVMSAVVRLKPLPREKDTMMEVHFATIVKAAFAHRRKTLENSFGLDPVLGPISASLLARAGVDGHRRAEDLTIQEYRLLAQEYFACCTVP
jgi:16S rRNA (adenine1518-N6/adenine1519-N6)-dimethyltransferase